MADSPEVLIASVPRRSAAPYCGFSKVLRGVPCSSSSCLGVVGRNGPWWLAAAATDAFSSVTLAAFAVASMVMAFRAASIRAFTARDGSFMT